MIKLTGKSHFERYRELCRIVEARGITDDYVPGLSQLLHLLQGMQIAEESYMAYRRKMNDWLNNIERGVISNIERMSNKSEVK